MRGDNHDPDTVFGRRLASFSELAPDEVELLRVARLGAIREGRARYDLIREGDHPHSLILIVQGWAARYKSLLDGRRQLVGFMLPGDLCDLNNSFLAEMDHSIGALTAVRYVNVDHAAVGSLSEAHPRIARALWVQLLATLSIQREWALNLGQRNAMERIAHLLCEMLFRLRAIRLAEATEFELPITQQDIADATGLTAVHVNRMLQELRSQSLVSLTNRTLRIPDLQALMDVALFTPNYLHLAQASPKSGRPSDVGVGL